jgi:hypothetical protein
VLIGEYQPAAWLYGGRVAKSPLFSTYRQGENRVTSSMLAVFERIDLSLLEALLAGAAGESSLQTVTFTNQPPGRGRSVPDGCFSARFAFWFEVKTAHNAVRADQLTEHLANLDGAGGDERLFVITPDGSEPRAVTELADRRVVWFGFRALSDAIDSTLADPVGLISEQARLLLRELQALLVGDGLVDSDDVVVVAARDAYPEYLAHGAYVCQPGRAFRGGVTHMGFYARTDRTGRAAIQPEVPEILYRLDHVAFTPEESARRRHGDPLQRRVGELIETLAEAGPRQWGQSYQVFLLSPVDSSATVRLAQPVINDQVDRSGNPTAWTMGQRYVNLARLRAPGTTLTSDLERP